MILVLEDEQWRRDFFAKHMGVERFFLLPNELVVALEAHGADVKQVFLDHDLGVVEPVDASTLWPALTREVTGRDACDGIVRLSREADLSHIEFIIHSLNPPGAEAMARTLKSAGLKVRRVPFYDLIQAHNYGVVLLDGQQSAVKRDEP